PRQPVGCQPSSIVGRPWTQVRFSDTVRPMRRAVIAFCAALLFVPRPVWAEELLVFAAASLTDVLRDLGASYEKTSHDTVTFNFGASGDLARQITAGAPADVFFSADAARM